jgi:crotonobetainyl-CoA:carnitine CoA-transferase CaiB-like acyl-CoA transferase
MMALWHRERSGRGQVIDMNILQPIMTAVGPAPTVYQQLGVIEQRHGNRSTNNAPRNTYQTADGKWVAISTSAQRIAERVMHLVGHPEVIDEPWFRTGYGRVQHVDLLDAYVGDWIAQRSREEVSQAFAEAGAAIAPVYNAQDLVEDPHVRETEMLLEVPDDDLGPILQHNVMWRMTESPGRIRFTGRDLGQDTDSVLAELGYADEEIDQMRNQEVIR